MENVCTICPRACKVDRTTTHGFCGQSKDIKIAKVMLHKWEEPIISGENGSGAIFFSGCNLKCIYCQNYQISSLGNGEQISVEKLADIFKTLENMGANNINLVTPTHYSYQIVEALKIYRPNIPVVWNTSGYESVETLEKIKDYVDVYLTDLKYYSKALSTELSGATDYFDVATKAILKMRENQPKDVIQNGLMKKGLIVRYLVLPSLYRDSFAILEWIKENLGTDTFVSIMSQYTPCYKALKHKKLKRKLKRKEYDEVLKKVVELDFKNGFAQDLESSSTKFIPDFECESEIDFWKTEQNEAEHKKN